MISVDEASSERSRCSQRIAKPHTGTMQLLLSVLILQLAMFVAAQDRPLQPHFRKGRLFGPGMEPFPRGEEANGSSLPTVRSQSSLTTLESHPRKTIRATLVAKEIVSRMADE